MQRHDILAQFPLFAGRSVTGEDQRTGRAPPGGNQHLVVTEREPSRPADEAEPAQTSGALGGDDFIGHRGRNPARLAKRPRKGVFGHRFFQQCAFILDPGPPPRQFVIEIDKDLIAGPDHETQGGFAPDGRAGHRRAAPGPPPRGFGPRIGT